MIGELSVLNCNAGDIRITFDKEEPLEVERARRIIQDMLQRGYILFVEGAGGKLRKVKDFNAKTDCYVLADGPLYPGDDDGRDAGTEAPKKAGTKKKTGRKEVPMRQSRAPGIAPTAGG